MSANLRLGDGGGGRAVSTMSRCWPQHIQEKRPGVKMSEAV